MSQINVNTPNSGEPAGSSGMGMIIGVILALVVVAVVVWFFFLGGSGGGTPDGGNGDGGDGGAVESTAPAPSAWRLVDLA